MTQQDFVTWTDDELRNFIHEPPGITVQRHVEMAGLELATRAAGSGGPPSGSAGGALSGSYPNPGLAANAVTNAKLAMAPALTLKGNNTGVAAVPQDLTVLQVKTMLGISSTVGVTSGTGAPLGTDGVVGDFYLDEASGTWYKKTGASTWSNIGQATAFRGITATAAATNALANPRTNQTVFVTDTDGLAGGSTGVAGFAYYTGALWSVYSLVGSGGSYTHPNHTGDVTSAGDGATTIAADAVTNAKLANMAANTIKGNNTGASGDPVDLTVAQVKTLLAYTASDIASTAVGGVAATNVQSAIAELDSEKVTANAAITGATKTKITYDSKGLVTGGADATAADIINVPAGNIAATTVQAALNELDTEKQVNLQFQDEGVNLGTSGTATTIDFTGGGVTATRAGNVVTVAITGGAGATNLSVSNITATTLDVLSDTGTDATIPAATTTAAGVMTADDKKAVNAIGVAAGQADLDTFTGTTIPDDSTVKAALQALETATEGKQTAIQYKDEGANLGTAGTVASIDFVGSAVAATRVGNDLTVTVTAGPYVQYDAGNGALVTASATGVTFARTTASVWAFSIPAGVDLRSFSIYSTSAQNPGATVTISFNYTSNTVSNQGLSTARMPVWACWQMTSGATSQAVVGGAAASAWRPAIVEPVSGGNITFLAQSGSVMSTGDTTIGGTF